MRLPASADNFDAFVGLQGPLHLAIGVFDGVHLGHKAVVELAVFSARRSGGESGVLTFDPHPSRLFRPQSPTQLILPIEEKVGMLHKVGVDVVVHKHFDREYAAIPAEDFLAHLKTVLPVLRAVYVGSNFRFGKKRAGDVQTLIETGKTLGLDVFSIDRIRHNGGPISSTRIRGDLESGAIESVNDLLGYNYFSVGVIVGGAKLGREIGFPTLNLHWEPECRPKRGVYFVRYRTDGGADWFPAVANYGIRPTVANGESLMLEVHALEPTTLGAGDRMVVEWLCFIRPEQKFDTVEALKSQIAKDVETARRFADNA